MNIRPYDKKRDAEAVYQIWRETGWIEHDNETHTRAMDAFLQPSRSLVAQLNDRAECLVSCGDASIRHLGTDIPMSAVLAVTTSLIARKRGMASKVLAQAIAQEAQAGFPVSALDMFEQGYYSRLGFGTGPYEIKARFAPAQLQINHPLSSGSTLPVPVRLTNKDSGEMYEALTRRQKGHGAVVIKHAEIFHAETLWTEEPAGLGFRDADGKLSHFIWASNKGENGPFEVKYMAYENSTQLMELLSLLRSLGDQIFVVEMMDPPEIQLQDFLNQPFMRQETTAKSDYAEAFSAHAYWQIRINDLHQCLQHTQLPNETPLRFNLELDDPIKEFLPDDAKWTGISGKYVVSLGAQCSAQTGREESLPTLTASVGGFSRLWLGCASASAIALAGEITAEPGFLETLDSCLRLPTPHVTMEF